MIYDNTFEKSIQALAEGIRQSSFSLDPEKCLFFQNTKVDKHYTVVIRVPEPIATEIYMLGKELQEIEPSLITGQKENLHFTLFYLPDTVDPRNIRDFLESFFAENHFNFQIENIAFMNQGIGAVAYPKNDGLARLRQKLLTEFNYHYPHPELMLVSWVAIARYSQAPSKKLLDFLKQNFDREFGFLKLEDVEILENEDKYLSGAKLLYSVKNS